MKRLAAVVLACFGIVASHGAAAAVTTTSPFADVNKVAEDLAQEFYRAWRLRISELPANYQQIATRNGVQYRAPNKSGCQKTNSLSLFQPVTEVLVAHKTAPGELTETVTYRGCSGEIILIESIFVKGTDPQPTPAEELLTGKRRFVHSSDETTRRSTFIDPVLGPIIEVASDLVDPATSAHRFFVMGKSLAAIWRRTQSSGAIHSRIELEDFDVRLKKFGSLMRSTWRGLKTRFSVLSENGVLHFKIEDEVEFSTQRRFEEQFSQKVVAAVNYSATAILDLYIGQLPKTEVAKPSAGANQRILEELNLALVRVTSNSELERVRTLIQEYIESIQNGQLSIDDRRPK